MRPVSQFLLPPPALASCIAGAIYRDTRGAGLSAPDRLNYFPATPLYSVSRVFEGQLHMARTLCDIDTLQSKPPLPSLTATPPQDTPVTSWSPNAVQAVTVAIYPDAWIALGGHPDGGAVPDILAQALMADCGDHLRYWDQLCAAFAPIWATARQGQSGWQGSHRLVDWARHITTAAAFSGPGRSLRSIERRLRRWTGQSRQSIDFFAKLEDLHRHSAQNPDLPLAQIAADADFADQSHMGRAVKRATGFSPQHFNRRVATQEPFWCYRLLGERF